MNKINLLTKLFTNFLTLQWGFYHSLFLHHLPAPTCFGHIGLNSFDSVLLTKHTFCGRLPWLFILETKLSEFILKNRRWRYKLQTLLASHTILAFLL